MCRAQLQLGNWSSARDYLARALAAGAGPDARLLRVQALLLGAGDFDGANQEMTQYLGGRDVKNMPLPVRQLWARVQDKKKIAVAYLKVKTNVNESIDYFHKRASELAGLVPTTDQSLLPEKARWTYLWTRGFTTCAWSQTTPPIWALPGIAPICWKMVVNPRA